ncbi:MAG: ABC transporter permease [Candidatus Eisenbacteria bacterium]
MNDSRFEPVITNLRAAWARAYVRIFAASREPSWMLSETLLPVIGMCAYVFVYRALGAPRAYEAFVVLGGVMMAYWLGVLWSMGTQFYWEKQDGNLEFYLMAPCSRMAILSGMALGGVVMTSLRALSALALGLFVFRVPFDLTHGWTALAVFTLTLGSLYALGMCLASLFLMYGREVWHLAHALEEPVYLANGLYFPVRALGPWVAGAIGTVPLATGLDAMRQLLLGAELAKPLLPVATEIGILVGSLFFYIGLAIVMLRWTEARGKRLGTLILRHQ